MTDIVNHYANRTLIVSCTKDYEGLCAVEDPEAPGTLLATGRSKAVVLVLFLLYVFGVGVSCRNLYFFVVYLYVNGSGSITSVGEERELMCLLLFTCNYMVFERRVSSFHWVHGMGYDILLWHSLSLPYNYFRSRCFQTQYALDFQIRI